MGNCVCSIRFFGFIGQDLIGGLSSRGKIEVQWKSLNPHDEQIHAVEGKKYDNERTDPNEKWIFHGP